MSPLLPLWLTDFARGFHRNDVLAELGKEKNRAMLLEQSNLAREALKFGLRPFLYDLLDKNGILLDGMLRLVATGATTEESFLSAIFENAAFSDLKHLAKDRPLRLRHTLYSAGELLEDSSDADKFLRSFPTPQHVRSARAAALFPITCELNPAAARAIMKIYAEDNLVREKIVKNGIGDGNVADFIEQNEALTDVSMAVQKAQAAGVDSRAVRRFCENLRAVRELESAYGDEDDTQLDAKRPHKARIDELEKLQTKLAEEEQIILSQNKHEEEVALKRLQKLKQVVQPRENWDRPINDTPLALLKELQTCVEQSLDALHNGDYDTITEVASLASGGLLRRGMVLLPSRMAYSGFGGGRGGGSTGQAGGGIHCHQGVGSFKPAPLSAFGEPQYLTNFSASAHTPTIARDVSTASLDAFTNFQNCIQTHGLDYAARMHFGGFGSWGVVAGCASGKNHKHGKHGEGKHGRSELKTACVAKCDELPMCSFEPATAAMTFTEDAVRALAEIGRNHVKALQFMEKYGEVVPMGKHTLGGVRILKMTLEKTSAEGSALTFDAVDKEWKISVAGGGFFVFGGGVAVDVQGHNQNALNEGTAQDTHAYRRTVDTVLIGPPAVNRGTFCDALRSSNKTWHVIRRDLSFKTLVPIWEVIEHSRVSESLRDPVQVAQVLRSAWCNRALKVIKDDHSVLLDEHKDLVIQLYNAGANSPLAVPGGPEGSGAGASHSMDWVPKVLEAVQVEINAVLTATGDDVSTVRRSALVEAFRVVRMRAPREWQAAPELRYLPFQDREFCRFVESLLESQSSGGELVLRARLHGPEMIRNIKRLLRGHTGGTNAAVRSRYPYLTGFLAQLEVSKEEDLDEFTTVSALGADFPDAISLDDTCKWLRDLCNPDDKISDSSRSSAACQVLQAALAALEEDSASLSLDEEKARMYTHVDHFNRICRHYHFMRDRFLPNNEPGAEDLRGMANELCGSLLRKFDAGDFVKKSVLAPRWEGSINGNATLYGIVVGHDKAQTAHVRVKWLYLKGVDVLEVNGEEATCILGEHWKEDGKDNIDTGGKDLNAIVTYTHISDLERAPHLPSPSSEPRNSHDRSSLANAEPFSSRLRLCADRSSEQTPSAPLRYVDNLRWRLPDVDENPSPRTSVYSSKNTESVTSAMTAKKTVKRFRRPSATIEGGGAGASTNSNLLETSSSSGSGSSPVMDVYNDLENAEEVDQVLICAALLDQRKAVPLFWKRQAVAANAASIQVSFDGKEKANNTVPAVDILPVLAFLRARLEKPRYVADLHTDEKLPRVVFYEPYPHTRPSAAQMANEILHTNFRRNTPTNLLVSLEMSIGFIDEQQCEDVSFAPCLVFLVRGDAHLLPTYLKDAFETGVIVVSSCSVALSLEKLPDFFTRSDRAYGFSLEPCVEMPDNWYGPIEEIPHETLLETLKEFVKDVLDAWRDDEHRWGSMRSLFSSLRVSKQIQAISSGRNDREIMGDAPPVTQTTLFACATEDPFRNLDIPVRNVRSSMKLQELFREEARIEDKERDRDRYRLHDIRTRLRPRAADRMLKHPLMVAFIETLQASTRTQRLLRLQRLDGTLAEASLQNPLVSRAQQEIDRIDNETRRFMTSEAGLNILKQERRKHVSERYNNSVDLACLWRELGHLYSSLFETRNRRDVEYLPDLAAKLLLDGGTIEFMDGDAAKVNEFWVASVLRALNLQLKAMHGGRDVRVSVRSVFGMQSCGKSTVLNCMYGCRLPTSAGMCTRGINMFIVPCERSGSPYEAILGLDTEGICSPEQERQDASETALINNRMALFCVLLADAGLCISTTESNDIFRETLSIVMAVYHGSDMAAEQGNMRTRLFFLYNRSSCVDEVNGIRMKLDQDRVFLDVLKGAWKLASNQLGGTKEEGEIVPPAFLALLDQDKDIERVQQLNKGSSAPDDVPDRKFGRKLAEFSDHIHQSITQGRRPVSSAAAAVSTNRNCGTSLSEFIQRFKDVNEAVHWGKNYLLYPDIVRYKQKVREDAEFEASVHDASKLSYDAFIELQSEMVSEHETLNQEGRDSTNAGAAADIPAAAKDWESSPWPSRTRQKVYEVFNACLVEMRRALQRLMGDSFDQKIAEYERRWSEKAKVDSDAKLMAMRMKWTVLNGIAPRLKALQNQIYRKLYQEATIERERATEISSEVAYKMFDKVFAVAKRNAAEDHPNVVVQHRLLFIALNDLQPGLTFGTGNRSLQWYKNLIYASQPLMAQRYGTDWRRPWSYLFGESAKEYVNGIYEETERMAMSASDEFSDHVVHEILNDVEQRIKEWDLQHPGGRFTDSQRTDIHMLAIARIGDILQRKQDHYHERHGLAARFAMERENMYSYFEITLQGKIGQDALADMLRVELTRCVRTSRITFAVKHARLLLDSEPWLRSIEGSLALVDYEILQHYKNGSKIEALRRAGDANCFMETIAERIVLSLDAEKVHNDMIHDLKNSLLLAKDTCVKAAGDVSPWRAALGELNTRATAKNLTIDLAASVTIVDRSPPVTENLEQIAETFFEELVDWLSQVDVDTSPFDGNELYEYMGKDMPTEGALQARCGAGCPWCQMPCMKVRGHNSRYTGDQKLHSCTHQPSGLAGKTWKSTRYFRRSTKHLMWESCVESTRRNYFMIRDDGSRMPFKRFRDWYPEWEQPPPAQHARPVREFLFYNCQPELVQKYPGKKKCSNVNKSNFSRHRLDDLLRTSASIAFGRDP